MYVGEKKEATVNWRKYVKIMHSITAGVDLIEKNVQIVQLKFYVFFRKYIIKIL